LAEGLFEMRIGAIGRMELISIGPEIISAKLEQIEKYKAKPNITKQHTKGTDVHQQQSLTPVIKKRAVCHYVWGLRGTYLDAL